MTQGPSATQATKPATVPSDKTTSVPPPLKTPDWTSIRVEDKKRLLQEAQALAGPAWDNLNREEQIQRAYDLVITHYQQLNQSRQPTQPAQSSEPTLDPVTILPPPQQSTPAMTSTSLKPNLGQGATPTTTAKPPTLTPTVEPQTITLTTASFVDGRQPSEVKLPSDMTIVLPATPTSSPVTIPPGTTLVFSSPEAFPPGTKITLPPDTTVTKMTKTSPTMTLPTIPPITLTSNPPTPVAKPSTPATTTKPSTAKSSTSVPAEKTPWYDRNRSWSEWFNGEKAGEGKTWFDRKFPGYDVKKK